MRNRRDRRSPNKMVVHITNRTVCGLPFVCRLFMSLIIRMLLAKAQCLHPVQVCHFQFMGNHFHMILAGRGKAISAFMGFFQGELAKYIKLIVPKTYQSKFWSGRFKEQKLCTAVDVMAKIVYIYANPTRAGLVRSISEWPGVSSWKMFINGSTAFSAKFVSIRDFKKVACKILGMSDSKASQALGSIAKAQYEFKLSPYVWKRCFKESAIWSDEFIHKSIVSKLSERERLLKVERGSKPVLGVFFLKNQSIRQSYEPQKKGRTPFLICHDPELRAQFKASYRHFCAMCKSAWEDWKRGVVKAAFPSGCFRPWMPVIQV